MSMFTFMPTWISAWKNLFKDEVNTTEFYAQSQWNTGEIVSKQVLPNGRMRVLIRIVNPTTSEIAISKIRIVDPNAIEIGEQDVSITLDSDAEEILYSLDFDIFQVTVNVDDSGEYDKVE